MFKMKINNKLVISFVILVMGLSSLITIASAQEVNSEETIAVLPICNHNDDVVRDLSDVAIFAGCAETFDVDGNGRHDLADISLYTSNNQDDNWCATNFKCTPDHVVYSSETPFSGGSGTYQPKQSVGQQEPTPEPEVLGEKIEAEGEVLGEKIEAEEEVLEEVCTYNTPDTDVLGKTEWADGSLLRGCGPEVYVIENQQKRHIKSLEELFKYIGQRINNVTNDILNLF